MKNRILSSLLGAMVALAAMVGGIESAHAGIVTGDYDPAFTGSPPITNYSWSGKVTFDIPDACLNQATGGPYSTYALVCQPNSILGGTLHIFQTSTPTNFEDLVLSWASPTTDLNDIYLNQSLAAADRLTGMDTLFSNWTATSTLTGCQFKLSFSTAYTNPGANLVGTGGNCGSGEVLFLAENTTYSVPEPDSLWLMAMALGLVVGIRRRRQ